MLNRWHRREPSVCSNKAIVQICSQLTKDLLIPFLIVFSDLLHEQFKKENSLLGRFSDEALDGTIHVG